MPSPFVFFDSMAEFAATPGARLQSRNLRLAGADWFPPGDVERILTELRRVEAGLAQSRPPQGGGE